MAEDVTYLTPEGKEEMEQKLQRLQEVDRPALAQKLKEAVAMGDLKENADYHDTREKMSLMDGEIMRLEQILRTAEIIQNTGATDEVRLGSKVTIREEGFDEDEVYTIVGAAEANPRDGKISSKSPIGAALLHRRKGDNIKVKTPDGKVTFTVISIE
ncbi:MAG: transcription elongation factor GreA [Phototrophicaceae bacterium]